MVDLFKSDDYDPGAWIQLTLYDVIHFQYTWAYETCEKIVNTKGAKKLLEVARNVQFDVIVQDVTLSECMLALWEVSKKFTICINLREYIDIINRPIFCLQMISLKTKFQAKKDSAFAIYFFH